MFYAERDKDGKIIAIRTGSALKAEEAEPLSDEELENFLNGEYGSSAYESLLRAADLKMIRVLDDLIEVLVKKNVITFTDLPREAREKLGLRKEARKRLQESSPDITVDDIL
jgi:predicted RNase H-like nuclease (RuvC/YqgF family)